MSRREALAGSEGAARRRLPLVQKKKRLDFAGNGIRKPLVQCPTTYGAFTGSGKDLIYRSVTYRSCEQQRGLHLLGSSLIQYLARCARFTSGLKKD
jgi:hypothetical protein